MPLQVTNPKPLATNLTSTTVPHTLPKTKNIVYNKLSRQQASKLRILCNKKHQNDFFFIWSWIRVLI